MQNCGMAPPFVSWAEALITPVAWPGRGGWAIAPPIGMSTKMQNGKNTTFLALLRLFYALEWTA